jgi:hypothetical protein
MQVHFSHASMHLYTSPTTPPSCSQSTYHVCVLQDQGIMVRKRAIRALWECCSCPGFSRADDAVVTVLQRANDREDSMKSLVTKICGEMWFTAASNFAGMYGARAGSAIHACFVMACWPGRLHVTAQSSCPAWRKLLAHATIALTRFCDRKLLPTPAWVSWWLRFPNGRPVCGLCVQGWMVRLL